MMLMPFCCHYFILDLHQIDPDFVTNVEVLVPSIFAPENLNVKQINGENVRAHNFLACLETYVNTFDGDELPAPQSVLKVSYQLSKHKLCE